MSQLGEIEKMNTAAPDLKKQEQEIRSQVATELPNLSPEAQEAVIQSRLKILFNQNSPRGRIFRHRCGICLGFKLNK